jgi:uncharacterized protein (DUF305 family)
MQTHRRPAALALALAVLVLVVAGCGGGGGEAAGTAGPTADGAFDRAFIDGMVPHHEGALEMARSAEAAGLTVPELRRVAEAILETQQEEIDRMKAWRQEWFGSSEIDPEGAAALGLSDAEMGMEHDASALLNSSDPDGAFAAMMIDHHEGAIAMAELALRRAEHEELKQLAREIIDAQRAEIEVLRPHAEGGEHAGHG